MHRTRHFSSLVFLFTLLSFIAEAAWAVDGVIEISQVRALSGGVTTGDTAGFPVTISERGSFRLTSDLDTSTTGIDITADDVTIDLNGFTIQGTGVCSGFTGNVSCSVNAGGRGIRCNTGSCKNITIRNGTLRGHLDGISVGGSFTRIENVRIYESAFKGISVGTDALISGCTVSLSQDNGISANNRAVIRGNTIENNDDFGISVNSGSFVVDNVISNNGAGGLSGTPFVAYGGNYFDGNTTEPVVGGVGVEISTNVCSNVVCP